MIQVIAISIGLPLVLATILTGALGQSSGNSSIDVVSSWIPLLASPAGTAVAMWALYHKGFLRPGREFDAMTTRYESELGEVKEDRNFYRDSLFKALNLVEKQAKSSERVVDAVESAAQKQRGS